MARAPSTVRRRRGPRVFCLCGFDLSDLPKPKKARCPSCGGRARAEQFRPPSTAKVVTLAVIALMPMAFGIGSSVVANLTPMSDPLVIVAAVLMFFCVGWLALVSVPTCFVLAWTIRRNESPLNKVAWALGGVIVCMGTAGVGPYFIGVPSGLTP